MSRALPLAWGLLLAVLAAAELPRLWSAAQAALAGVGVPLAVAAALAALGRHAAVLLAGAAVLAGMASAGAGLLRWLAPGFGREGRSVWWLVPLGLGGAGSLLYGLALVGLWFPPVLWIAFGAAAAAGIPALPPRRALREAIPRRDLPLLAGVVWLAAGLPWTLAPETAPDCLAYGLAAPARWLAAHRAVVTGDYPYFHIPMLSDVPAGLVLPLGLDQVPKLWQGACALCGLLGLTAVAAPGRAGWAVLLWAVSATAAGFTVTGKNDGAAVGAMLLGLGAALAPGQGGALAGALTGVALGSKLVALASLPLVPLGRWLGRGRPSARWWFGWGTAALAVPAVWWTKAWWFTGDPLYPMLKGALPWLVPGADARNGDVWSIFLGSFAVAACATHQAQITLVLENAALVWLAPLAGLRPERPARAAALAGLASLALWIAAGPDQYVARYAFATLGAVVPAAALALADGWAGSGAAWRTVAVVLLGVGAASRMLVLPTGFGAVGDPLPYLAGAESARACRDRTFTVLAPMRRWLRAHPVPGRTLLLGEIAAFDLPGPCGVAMPLNAPEPPLAWRLAAASATPADVARRLRQLNAARLVYNPVRAVATAPAFGAFEWNDRMLGVWRAFFAGWAEVEWSTPQADNRNGQGIVYRLRPAPLAVTPARIPYLPGTEILIAPTRIEAQSPAGRQRTIEAMTEAVRRVPNVLQIEDSLAYAYRLDWQYETAYALYRRTVLAGFVDEGNVGAFGLCALRLGRDAEAEAALVRAAALYPDQDGTVFYYVCVARELRAFHLIEAGRLPEAEAVLAAGLADLEAGGARSEAAPVNAARFHALLALVRWRQGRGDAARAEQALAAPGLATMAALGPDGLAEAWREFAAEIRQARL